MRAGLLHASVLGALGRPAGIDPRCSKPITLPAVPSAGVLLLGRIMLQSNLDEHANFQTFPNAMLTLFRVAVGDDWTGILQVGGCAGGRVTGACS